MLSVILADDHELFRKGLELTLKNVTQISKIRHAENGSLVRQLLEQEPAHIVFMDIRMPVMNGIETTLFIKKKYPDIKIIALSMMDDRENILNMFRAGAHAYLLKNTNKKEISEAINTVMSGEKYYTNEVSSVLVDSLIGNEKSKKRNSIQVQLTKRELEVLKLICQQFSSKEISDILCITEKTVEGHRLQLMEKTLSKNVIGLVLYALENDIIKPF